MKRAERDRLLEEIDGIRALIKEAGLAAVSHKTIDKLQAALLRLERLIRELTAHDTKEPPP